MNSDKLSILTFPVGSFACNCSIISSKKTNEAIIIDPGNDSESIIKLVNNRGYKVKALLHTHAHFDHIGQSCDVKEATGAPIYLHQGDEGLYQHLEQQRNAFWRHT